MKVFAPQQFQVKYIKDHFFKSTRDISEYRQVKVGSTILHHRDDPNIIKYSESVTKQRNTTR